MGYSLTQILIYFGIFCCCCLFFQNIFYKICAFKESSNSYFHTRGHVPDDLILKACRNGTFVFKLQAPKICTMKAWKRNNRTSSRAKIRIPWSFWLPQVSNWLVQLPTFLDIDMFTNVGVSMNHTYEVWDMRHTPFKFINYLDVISFKPGN